MNSSEPAPEHPLPIKPFYSVEYPGYVRSTSVPLAIDVLGGQSVLETAFKRNATKDESLLELSLRPGNPFAHPVPGDVVGTNNILLKVVKRKRRKISMDVDGVFEPEGHYTAEAIGVLPKTVRFRSMVDFQYQPNTDDPVTKLRLAMDTMDVEAIRKYTIPPEREDYLVAEGQELQLDPQLTDHSNRTTEEPKMRSNLRLFPPPLFSRQSVPQIYNFKANNMSVVATTVDEETGEEKKRLVNKMRWKGYGPASIAFADKGVPDKPPQHVEEARDQADKTLLAFLLEKFKERPVWTRMSILNQFSSAESREIVNSKVLLPLVCYVFQDGPWRDTLIRFNYDPREDINARFYQRLYFRNLNHPIVRPSVITRRQEGRYAVSLQARAAQEQERVQEVDRSRSHIFDGVTLTNETAAFQLCDIHDPMLKELIENEDELRENCNERDGWYTTEAFELIKTILRHKFFSLLEGHVATEEECAALVSPAQAGSSKLAMARNAKRRYGKHNMAKGALPPEDVAFARLRATLDNNARNSQS